MSCPAYSGEHEKLNKFLEDNAVSAAYARMCDEEPMAEELKANTMMLLAVHGIEPHDVQLGSAKWSEILRKQYAMTKGARSVNCPGAHLRGKSTACRDAENDSSDAQALISCPRTPDQLAHAPVVHLNNLGLSEYLDFVRTEAQDFS
jgi:hypothetical protein